MVPSESGLARDGADGLALLRIVEAALAAWPANRIKDSSQRAEKAMATAISTSAHST